MRETNLVSIKYLQNLEKFAEYVRTAQLKEVAFEATILGIAVTVVGGRKYDKIVLHKTLKHPNKKGEQVTKTEVRYFVERSTGKIFGMKSPVAPNETRYYGRVENAKKWDWSGQTGVSVSDNSVTEVGEYAGCKHYEDKGASRDDLVGV